MEQGRSMHGERARTHRRTCAALLEDGVRDRRCRRREAGDASGLALDFDLAEATTTATTAVEVRDDHRDRIDGVEVVVRAVGGLRRAGGAITAARRAAAAAVRAALR